MNRILEPLEGKLNEMKKIFFYIYFCESEKILSIISSWDTFLELIQLPSYVKLERQNKINKLTKCLKVEFIY